MIDKYIPFERTLEYKSIFETQEHYLTNWSKNMQEVENRVNNYCD